MIQKLLIANRGEIACRIIKTAKKMAIETIAVFSEPDKNSLHVALADHAVCIGPAAAQQSYLNREKIIAVAKEQGVDAIHPGYGFLAEDSEFATRCEKNNIIFVGPSATCINAMGNKSLAKQMMQKAKIPTIPGYEGEKQSEKVLQQEANRIGYPLLIKAAAGGGGKGMRLVTIAADFLKALQEARQEAKASFDNDQVLLEKYLNPTRHIEVQIFTDALGQGVYLFDRDCSIQRRHQKIIEEAPAPHLSDALRKKMGETAVRAALAIQYIGAGTIEFLLDAQQNFYFMEMNTRLQVEHPVTEMITQQDLVEWQLNVASGKPLPLLQNELHATGHAIEARICAENPNKHFIPATGKLTQLHFPKLQEDIRIDSGVTEGDTISPYYDSMLAKLIVWAETRTAAVQKLQEQLAKIYILGVDTNISFLSSISKLHDFKQAAINTTFIQTHTKELWPEKLKLPLVVITVAIAAECRWRKLRGQQLAAESTDADSPWFCHDNWRLNATTQQHFKAWYANEPICHVFQSIDNQIIVEGKTTETKWLDELHVTASVADEVFHVAAIHQDHSIAIFYQGILYTFTLHNPNQSIKRGLEEKARFIAPMPSTVVEVLVSNGQRVTAGEKLMVLEAMKMQHTISSLQEGVVKEVYFKVGDLLSEGETLLLFEEGGKS